MFLAHSKHFLDPSLPTAGCSPVQRPSCSVQSRFGHVNYQESASLFELHAEIGGQPKAQCVWYTRGDKRVDKGPALLKRDAVLYVFFLSTQGFGVFFLKIMHHELLLPLLLVGAFGLVKH